MHPIHAVPEVDEPSTEYEEHEDFYDYYPESWYEDSIINQETSFFMNKKLNILSNKLFDPPNGVFFALETK